MMWLKDRWEVMDRYFGVDVYISVGSVLFQCTSFKHPLHSALLPRLAPESPETSIPVRVEDP